MIRRQLAKNFDALDAAEPFDVCVVGSGPAGTIHGTSLAEAGVRTLVLESGHGLIDWAADPRLKQLAEYEVSGDTNYPLTRTTARIVGGNSNFWTGRCERFHPSDFKTHPYTPPENPWPIGFEQLESYYGRAETILRARGGKLSEYAPPRQEEFLLPPRPNISGLKSLLANAGITVDDSPTATPTRGFRYFKVQKEILPRFLASGYGTLVSGATVTRLINDDANIVGAEVQTLDGATKVAQARFYVVCGGGIQTPRLLLLSRSERFPNGLGNDHDRVGRGFNEHPSLNFYARIPHSWTTVYPQHSVGRIHQFYETCRGEGLGAIHAVVLQSWIFPNHFLDRLVDIPKHLLKLLSRVTRAEIWMSPTLEMRPIDENRVTLSPSRIDPFGHSIPRLTMDLSDEDRRLMSRAREITLAGLKALGASDIREGPLTWSRHHIGSCRMGDDPRTSVVNRDLRVHPCPNLYLCGSEVFVTGAAVQPVLTISAFSLRLADHLAGVLRPRVATTGLGKAGTT